MKVLHINDSLTISGLNKLLSSLVNELADSQDISVCTFGYVPPDNILECYLKDSVKRISLKNTDDHFLTMLLNVYRIYRVVKSGHYDIVHIHQHFMFYAFTIFMLRHHVKFFYTIHTDAFMENGTLGKMFRWLKRSYFKKKWLIPVTISPASQESFYKLYQCSSILIPNGISLPKVAGTPNIIDEYRSNGFSRVFIHAGRISRVKNQLTLCKVFKRLQEHNPDIVLLIAGPKEKTTIWNNIEPYLSRNIVYIGERSDIIELFAKADGMCLPSLYEGLPITLLESLAVSCIPICSPVGGIVNVINNGVNGILSKSSSEEDYFKAMHEFLLIPDESLFKMKEAARASFAKYDICNTAQAYLRAYNEAIDR